MKSHTEYLTINHPQRMGFLNITPRIEEIVRKSGIQEGLTLVNAMHITASVFINDDEPGLHHDYAKWLEQLAPFDASPTRYHHNRTGEDNADAHINARSWAVRSSWPSPRASSTSGHGNKSSTASLMGVARSGCWSRSSGNDLVSLG